MEGIVLKTSFNHMNKNNSDLDGIHAVAYPVAVAV